MTRAHAAIAVLGFLLTASACDPCAAASRYHTERCASGASAESCEWLADHVVGGACVL